MGIGCKKTFGKYRSIFDKLKKEENEQKMTARREAKKDKSNED